MAWGKSTKQRRSAQSRRWIARHLFRLPCDGNCLFLSGLSLFGGRPPFGPSRLLGLGWRFARNRDGMVL